MFVQIVTLGYRMGRKGQAQHQGVPAVKEMTAYGAGELVCLLEKSLGKTNRIDDGDVQALRRLVSRTKGMARKHAEAIVHGLLESNRNAGGVGSSACIMSIKTPHLSSFSREDSAGGGYRDDYRDHLMRGGGIFLKPKLVLLKE